MTQKSLDMIHEAYLKAAGDGCKNPVSITNRLVDILNSLDIIPEDVPAMDLFIDKISKSIPARRITFKSTNMCTEILHTAMYIVIWMIDELGLDIDTNITARRKSLESELTKELDLADHLIPTQIKDRFGIRFIILNENDAITTSCAMATKILNVLCSLNRTDRKKFSDYIQKFDLETQERIRKTLDIPFVIEPLRRTDTKKFIPEDHPNIELPTEQDRKLVSHLVDNMKFYFDPKWNGYQSMHFILSIDTISPKMPGFQIELQFRTWKMHVFAENDIDASHVVHKGEVADYARVFHLSEKELQKVNIRGFNSYKDAENDLDGIYFPKVFYNRRMNKQSFEDDIISSHQCKHCTIV